MQAASRVLVLNYLSIMLASAMSWSFSSEALEGEW